MLSWSSWTATKSFFLLKVVFRKTSCNAVNFSVGEIADVHEGIVSKENVDKGPTDPVKTSVDWRKIALVNDAELEKKKASRTPLNTNKPTLNWSRSRI